MEIVFAPRGILQIDNIDGRDIMFRNFEGRGDKFNREGDRNFSLRLRDPETADALANEGWNVRVKPARDEDEDDFRRLPIKIKFTDYGPNIYLWSGNNRVELDEESIGCLDNIEIDHVNMDVRPYNWVVNGNSGRTAFLQTIEVFQRTNRFEERYNRMNKDEMLDF
jgi:hypothetical protein